MIVRHQIMGYRVTSSKAGVLIMTSLEELKSGIYVLFYALYRTFRFNAICRIVDNNIDLNLTQLSSEKVGL